VGTTFKVYLPTLERLATAVGTKLAGSVPKGRAGERVLVAEDDARVRAVVVRILRQAGYEVEAVDSGDAACLLAAREPFDLVLLDVIMPGQPCRETMRQLAAIQPTMSF